MTVEMIFVPSKIILTSELHVMLPLYSTGLRKSRNNAVNIAWRSRYINIIISPFLNFNNNLSIPLPLHKNQRHRIFDIEL